MSKASEWAVRLQDAQQHVRNIEQDEARELAFFLPDGNSNPAAWVDTSGDPYFGVRGPWTREHALALAHWIIDTFGEEG